MEPRSREGEHNIMSKRVLVVTGDGGEGYEAWYAVHRFQEEGFEPVVAAPSVKRLHLVMHDFEPGWDTYIEKVGYGMEADISLDDLKENDYDAVLIIGGRAPEYLRHHGKLIDLLKSYHKKGKWIFSICHGIQVLVGAGILDGRIVTCYEPVRTEVEMAGATYDTKQAHRDGHLVTAQTWESHPDFYREVMKCLRES
jgi:protease I